MKKIIYIILMIICFVPNSVKADNKVKVYLFRGEGCSFCESAISFFNGLPSTDKAKFELIQYEVWNNKSNRNLMNKVASKLGDYDEGVPYIVIGENSFYGFGSTTGKELLNVINKMYANNDFTDIMEDIETVETPVEETVTEEELNDIYQSQDIEENSSIFNSDINIDNIGGLGFIVTIIICVIAITAKRKI